MRASTDLFKLIQSLTRSEKRYFKLMASQHGRDHKYLALFDAIDRQDEYNESAIKEQFRTERFVRQFSVAKHDLYDLILKSLRSYAAGSTVSLQLRDIMSNVEILNDKGLYSQALKSLEKGIALAIEHDRFLWLIEASEWEAVLRSELSVSEDDIARHARKQKHLVDQAANVLEYRDLLRQVSTCIKDDFASTSESLERLDKLASHPLLTDPDRALTKRSELYRHWTWATYHFAHNRFADSLDHANGMIDVLESQPHRLRDDCTLYVLSLGNALTLHRRCQDYDGFMATMAKLQRFREEFEEIKHLRSPRVASNIFQTMALYKLAFHNSYAEFEECIAMGPEIEAGLEEHGEYIRKNYHYKFFGNLCYAHFALGNVRVAIDYNNRILCDRLPDEGRHSYFAAHLVQMILHYELGHTQLLESLIPSAERFLRKHDAWGPLEEAIVGFFRRAMRLIDEDDMRREYESLLDTIEEVSENPLTQNALRYFGYDLWVQSKLTGRTIADAAQAECAVQSAAVA